MSSSLIFNQAAKAPKLWKHAERALLALIVLFLAALATLSITVFAIPEMYHQMRWQAFANPFLNYPLPPDTTEIRRERSFGNLGAAGNNCYYKVTRLLATELALEEIEAYYRDVSFPAVEPGNSRIAPIWGRDGLIGIDVRLKEIVNSSDTQPSLLIETGIYDGPYPPFGPQCH